jgi:hypothetical protein
VFFPAVKEKDGVEAVVKAFVARNQDNALKKRPMVCIFLRRFIRIGYTIVPYPDFAMTTCFLWLLLANTVLQGYEVTHRDIELLKLRNFTIGTKLDDSVLSSDDAQAKVKETMRGLLAFVCLPNAGGYIRLSFPFRIYVLTGVR